MAVESVFAPGVAGMGQALSPKGERIVREKMVHRDEMLDKLEKKGLNVEALAHRHHHGEGCAACGQDAACGQGAECAKDTAPTTLEDALRLIQRQQGEIEHLRHKLAVQENKIFLLQEALENLRTPEATPQDRTTPPR